MIISKIRRINNIRIYTTGVGYVVNFLVVRHKFIKAFCHQVFYIFRNSFGAKIIVACNLPILTQKFGVIWLTKPQLSNKLVTRRWLLRTAQSQHAYQDTENHSKSDCIRIRRRWFHFPLHGNWNSTIPGNGLSRQFFGHKCSNNKD